jgi:hypothetical protein
VSGLFARRASNAAVSKAEKIETGEQGLATAKQARRHRDVHPVDQASLEVLPDCGGTSEQPNVFVSGGGLSLLERGPNTISDKVEDRASLHLLR